MQFCTYKSSLKKQCIKYLIPFLGACFYLFCEHWFYALGIHIQELEGKAGYHLFNFEIPLDKLIPHITIVFGQLYFVAICWGIVGPICIYIIYGRKTYFKLLALSLVGDIAGAIFFMLFPCYYTLGNPTAPVGSIGFGGGSLPSFHVMSTYFIFIAARQCFKVKHTKGQTIFTGCCFAGTGLVALTTGFIKAHYVMDSVGAIVLCEVVTFITSGYFKRHETTYIEKIITSIHICNFYITENYPHYAGADRFTQKISTYSQNKQNGIKALLTVAYIILSAAMAISFILYFTGIHTGT